MLHVCFMYGLTQRFCHDLYEPIILLLTLKTVPVSAAVMLSFQCQAVVTDLHPIHVPPVSQLYQGDITVQLMASPPRCNSSTTL